jgi:hypothetical protein
MASAASLIGKTNRREKWQVEKLAHGPLQSRCPRAGPQPTVLILSVLMDDLHGQIATSKWYECLAARLRPSNIDASAGSREELQRIVKQIRAVWPGVRILVRGDSGFCRQELMAWCEAESVDYVLGLAKNKRLKAQIKKELRKAKRQYQETGCATRFFREFYSQTRKSWSQQRRVVAKAEHLEKGENPRFGSNMPQHRMFLAPSVSRRPAK